jgi:hypothetical protein
MIAKVIVIITGQRWFLSATITQAGIRDFDLRSGPVRAIAIATQSSFSLKTFLLQPVLPPAYPAYLSNVQLICTWLRK